MLSFNQFVESTKEDASIIRDKLKKELGLSSRDVSVKSDHSSIKAKIKTMKALIQRTDIEKIASSKESYQRDQASGEILMGGNTFVFTEIDRGLNKKLSKIILDEFEKQSGGEFEDGSDVKIFNTFQVVNSRGTMFVTMRGVTGMAQFRNILGLGDAVLQFIKQYGKDDKLYSKIK